MNTTFYKDEVDALKKMAETIESHKPQIGKHEGKDEDSSKSLIAVVGIIVATILGAVGFLTWWLVS